LSLGLYARLFYDLYKLLYGHFESRIGFQALVYFLTGMHDRSVIPAAEFKTEFRSGIFGNFPGDVHGYLSRKNDFLGSFLAFHIIARNIEIIRNGPDDVFDGDVSMSRLVENIFQKLLGDFQGYFFLGDIDIGAQGYQGGFQVAYVRRNVSCDDVDDIVGNAYF